MLVQGFQNPDGCVVITGKNRIERDPLILVQKFVHDLISNVAFEIAIEYQIFVHRDVICL